MVSKEHTWCLQALVKHFEGTDVNIAEVHNRRPEYDPMYPLDMAEPLSAAKLKDCAEEYTTRFMRMVGSATGLLL